MKEIMISIKPQWVEKILNHTKTIEIRKTKPKCELPCKVYIYCTKNNGKWLGRYPDYQYCDKKLNCLNGKVVAEFTLNRVDEFHIPYEAKYLYDALTSKNEKILKQSCLDIEEILKYLKDKYYGYAWHIDNLKIYDKPKELSEFGTYCNGEDLYKCYGCEYYCVDTSEYETYEECCCNNIKPLRRPPQSWCYVEKVGK